MSKYILTPLAHGAEIRQWAGHKRLNTRMHLAVDAHGMPLQFFITSGTTADCTIAAHLMEGFQAEFLADQGYDTDTTILKVIDEGMIPIIPPRKTENTCGNTINISANSAISLRMLSYFSRGGAALLHAALKTLPLSLLLFKSVALPFDSLFIDDTI